MTEEKQPEVEVNKSTLRIILSPVRKCKHKILSVMKDHYEGVYKLQDSELLIVTEMQVSVMVLVNFIEFALTSEPLEKSVMMSPEELQTLTVLLSAIEAYGRIPFGQHLLTLGEH